MEQMNQLLRSKKEKKILTVTKLVLGPSTVVYGGNDKPLLSCGARVVILTESEVEVVK